MKKNNNRSHKNRRPQRQKARGYGGSFHGDSWDESRHARRRRSEIEQKEKGWKDYYREDD